MKISALEVTWPVAQIILCESQPQWGTTEQFAPQVYALHSSLAFNSAQSPIDNSSSEVISPATHWWMVESQPQFARSEQVAPQVAFKQCAFASLKASSTSWRRVDEQLPISFAETPMHNAKHLLGKANPSALQTMSVWSGQESQLGGGASTSMLFSPTTQLLFIPPPKKHNTPKIVTVLSKPNRMVRLLFSFSQIYLVDVGRDLKEFVFFDPQQLVCVFLIFLGVLLGVWTGVWTEPLKIEEWWKQKLSQLTQNFSAMPKKKNTRQLFRQLQEEGKRGN